GSRPRRPGGRCHQSLRAQHAYDAQRDAREIPARAQGHRAAHFASTSAALGPEQFVLRSLACQGAPKILTFRFAFRTKVRISNRTGVDGQAIEEFHGRVTMAKTTKTAGGNTSGATAAKA